MNGKCLHRGCRHPETGNILVSTMTGLNGDVENENQSESLIGILSHQIYACNQQAQNMTGG